MDSVIVLASASPRRKALLKQAGLDPDIIKPADIDENIDEKDPERFVAKLSKLKAQDVAKSFSSNEIIIGSDTVVVCDETILGKPENRDDAKRMIRMIEGRSHYVYTAVTLIFKDGKKSYEKTFVEKTEVMLYPISDKEIDEYLRTGDADDKAGSYGIQGPFARFVKGIRGDYNSVVGLPAGRVYQEIRKVRV